MAEPLQIDVAGATQALTDAGIDPTHIEPQRDPFHRGEHGHFAPKPAESKPDESATPVEGTEPAAEPAATPQGTEEPVSFGMVTDDAILKGELTPEQLVAWKRAIHADFTLKTQEAAPWRKLGQELGIEKPEDFRQTAEIAQRIQDPRNWPQITQELTEYMQSYGMSPAEARVEANQQLANFATPTATPDLSQQLTDAGYDSEDPSLAPLMQALQAQQQQIASLTQSFQQQQAQSAEAKQQAEWNAIAGALTTAENELRAQNPHYTDKSIEAIYAFLAPGGDPAEGLRTAALKYDAVIGEAALSYIKSKGQAHATTPNAPSGGGVIPQPDRPKLTIDGGHAAALAHVAELDRLDATT